MQRKVNFIFKKLTTVGIETCASLNWQIIASSFIYRNIVCENTLCDKGKTLILKSQEKA